MYYPMTLRHFSPCQNKCPRHVEMFSVAQRSKTIMDSLAVYISYIIIMQSDFKSLHDPDRGKHRNHSRILSQPEA